MTRIVLFENIHPSAKEVFNGAGLDDVVTYASSLQPDALREALAGAQAVGIRSRTHLDAALLAGAPDLRVIGCFCIGTNQVDLDAAMLHGVPVFNAPFSNTRSVAELMVRTFPDRFVATITKAKRHGKILIDYFRNAREATAVGPYVVRSRANAPVAMPIGWDELDEDVRNDHFNVNNARERLASLEHDPWADFLDTKQTITAAMRKRLGR